MEIVRGVDEIKGARSADHVEGSIPPKARERAMNRYKENKEQQATATTKAMEDEANEPGATLKRGLRPTKDSDLPARIEKARRKVGGD